jgi:ABC-2 type transport system ATP-binding protein
VTRDADATRYILRCEPAEFEQRLTAGGAKVIESGPLSLNEIFLELCRTSESTEEEMARV